MLGICNECDTWVEDPRKRSCGQLPPTTSLDEIRREYAKLEALIKIEECTGHNTWQEVPTGKWITKELLGLGT